MAAPTDASGTMKYWFNGQPYAGINKSTNDMGSMKYWFNGLPGGYVFPASVSVSTRLTMMGFGT